MGVEDSSPMMAATERLFDEFLERLEAGDAPRFEDFASASGPHEAQLWELYERWCRSDATLEQLLPGPAGSSLLLEPGPEDGGARGDGSSDPAGMHPGRVIGDYRLVRRLGRGGMGEVWEAEQLSLRRRVALKLLRTDRRGSNAARLLAQEARAGGRVSHEGIVAIYAAGEADGVAWIAQQLVPGGLTLADVLLRLQERPHLPAAWYQRIARLFADVADALHAAHEAGVLHRDLKPRNVLIHPDDRALVSDFGLARLADEDTDDGRPGLVGTLAYMSPEQASGRVAALDRRSDVFGLGAVFYEALTLRRAFEGDDPRVVMQRVLHEDPPSPRSLRATVPRDLALICTKALSKSRHDRYASMADFAADLRRHLRSEPILARPEGALERAAKWCRRHPAWTAATALTSAALVVISAMLLHEVELRRLAVQRAEETLRQSYLANIRAVAMSLDRGDDIEARGRLQACAPERRGWEWRHLALRADPAIAVLPGTGSAVEAVATTEGGRRIVTGAADGSVRLWDGETGALLFALTGHSGPVRSVAIAADASTVVSGGDDGTVRVWDGATGVRRAVLVGHHGPVSSVAASDDGQRLVSGSDDGTARLWDGRQGRELAVLPSGNVGFSTVSISGDGRRMVSSSRYGAVWLWDGATGDALMQLPWLGPTQVRAVISRDGTRIVTGGEDGAVRLWDTAAGERLLETAASGGPIASVALSADGRRAVTADAELGEVRLWDLATGKAILLARHEGRVGAVAISPDGTRVVSGSSEGTARVWDAEVRGASLVLAELEQPPNAVAASADAGTIVTASLTEPVARVLDGATGVQRAVLVGHEAAVAAVAVTSSGDRIVTGSFDGSVGFWDGRTGALLERWKGRTTGVVCVAVDAAGERVASGSQDGTLAVWRAGRQDAELLIAEGRGSVTSVALAADGQALACAWQDGTVSLRDLASGTARVLSTGSWFDDVIVAISADGGRVAAASLRGDTARVWNAADGRELSVLRSDRVGFTGLLLSGDGSRLVTCSPRDANVRVWDADSAEMLAVLSGHGDEVTAVAMSGDGAVVVSASRDRTVRLWESDPHTARRLWHALPAPAGR